MTCERFLEMLKLQPESCTTAERGAHRRHFYECTSCREALIGMTKELAKDPVKVHIARARADALLAKDEQDPEWGGVK